MLLVVVAVVVDGLFCRHINVAFRALGTNEVVTKDLSVVYVCVLDFLPPPSSRPISLRVPNISMKLEREGYCQNNQNDYTFGAGWKVFHLLPSITR